MDFVGNTELWEGTTAAGDGDGTRRGPGEISGSQSGERVQGELVHHGVRRHGEDKQVKC